jgi:hypothetical protein
MGGQELLRLRAAGGVEREGEDGTAEVSALPWRGEEIGREVGAKGGRRDLGFGTGRQREVEEKSC